jgi:hypothetical protein
MVVVMGLDRTYFVPRVALEKYFLWSFFAALAQENKQN